MTRRKLFNLLASLPFVGEAMAKVAKLDGFPSGWLKVVNSMPPIGCVAPGSIVAVPPRILFVQPEWESTARRVVEAQFKDSDSLEAGTGEAGSM